MVITLDTDANDGTFSSIDIRNSGATVLDTSAGTVGFTVNTVPSYSLTNLDVYQSATRALDDGTAICLGVDLTTPSACNGNILSATTYQFQATVTNSGEQAGTPNSIEFQNVVAVNDVLGTIPVSSLDTGCDDDGTDRVWTDSISTDDAVGTAGTTCSIEVSGSEIYYWIVTIDPDADDGTGTFFITDGVSSDSSSLITFALNPPPDPITDLLAAGITFSTVDLYWSEPELYSGTLIGYQINYTTPFGTPLTIITNNTENFQFSSLSLLMPLLQ